ncbi:hypothetical protein C8034_v001206 [Colletotrichum sidae]|uniref:Secreted protein n=1 Tax=Colletotrichum sidae TaxID=1347389 RepID=A0A4R8TV15_9PEZI|nr:hypothetical protein C8034_v001206 [Colletotrichum sidae]
MKSFYMLFATAALLAHASAQTKTLSVTPARAFFIYDSHPTPYVDASVVAFNRQNTTYEVACPCAATACNKEGYYPANITHQGGSIWAGTNTATPGITKSWRCELGSGSDDVIPDQYGRCSVTTDAGGTLTVDDVLPVTTCFVEARSVVAALTAGLDKVATAQSIDWQVVGAYNLTFYLSLYSSIWQSNTCQPSISPTPTGSWTASASASESGKTTAVTGSVGSERLPTETGTASGAATGAATPSESALGGSDRVLVGLTGVVGAAVVVGVVAAL